MLAREEANGMAGDYTQDGTVDIKGRPVLRSRTGRWKACSFVVTYEVFERMAFYGIASNLFTYLTTELREGTVEASNNVTNWAGTVWMLPVVGAYIADARLGRFWTFFLSSLIYLSGMGLLTLVVSVRGLKPPPCHGDPCKDASNFQKGIFFTALYIVALGTGGTKPNISTIGADQFDDYEPKERLHKLSFFNWWFAAIFLGALFSNTVLVYVQDNVGWTLGYGLPTLGIAVSIVVFLVGSPFYRHKPIAGSPLATMAQVLVAAARKATTPVPNDPKELHELSLEEYSKSSKLRIDHTPSLRFLDKAAVKTGTSSAWMLCPVTQVEETKQMIKMLPVLLLTLIPSTMLPLTQTLFLKQGRTLDRKVGHFEIPPASLSAFITISFLISVVVYDRWFVPFVRSYTKIPRGITLLQRIGIGLLLHVIVMVTACLAERRRLGVAREHNIYRKDQIVPLSIFILLPQFVLMGVADAFVEVTKMEFFYDQAPEGMKSLGTAYFTTTLGIGYFLSTFFLTTVTDITKRHGGNAWVMNNLNVSHLDYYYAFLAIISFLNLLAYLLFAKSFFYNVDVDSRGCMQQESLQEATPAGNLSSTEGVSCEEKAKGSKGGALD